MRETEVPIFDKYRLGWSLARAPLYLRRSLHTWCACRRATVSFDLQIDTQKPQITSGYITNKDGVGDLTVRKPKDV